MGGKMLKKIADFEKVVHRKIVHHDEFCYRLKLMYLFLLHVVFVPCIDLCFLKLNIGNKYGLCSMLKKCPGIMLHIGINALHGDVPSILFPTSLVLSQRRPKQ
jgi:hypothetical protein